MPWQLSTPVDVGALDTNNYNQVNITRFTHDTRRNMMILQLEYGRTVDGEWITGYAPAGKETSITIQGQDYLDIVTHVSLPDELTYDAVKRGLYDWLSTNGKIDAGSVA